MFELPLFPLREVLFPGMPLHLHIFEERYKLMLSHCLETDNTFGVVLIRHGMEALGPLAEPYLVGCTARIIHTTPLGEGQMNLLAVGQDRFRILDLHNAQPYLLGNVESFPMLAGETRSQAAPEKELRALVEQYVRMATKDEAPQTFLDQLPQETVNFAFLAATLIQLPLEQKQELLELENLTNLLARLLVIYQREIRLQSALLASERNQNIGSFSMN